MDNAIRVNDVSLNNQYWSAIQCDDNGRIFIVYYDEREGPGQMNAYLAYSEDEGDTWTNERLSNETFFGSQPNSNVRYGDYIGIDAYDGKIVPVWTDSRAGGYKQEIYTAVIDIPIGVEEYKSTHEEFTLYQNYPNPFTEETRIHFELKQQKKVNIAVLNKQFSIQAASCSIFSWMNR